MTQTSVLRNYNKSDENQLIMNSSEKFIEIKHLQTSPQQKLCR